MPFCLLFVYILSILEEGQGILGLHDLLQKLWTTNTSFQSSTDRRHNEQRETRERGGVLKQINKSSCLSLYISFSDVSDLSVPAESKTYALHYRLCREPKDGG